MNITSVILKNKTTLSLLTAMIMSFVLYGCEKSPSSTTAQNDKDLKLIESFISSHSLSPNGEITASSSATEGSIPLADTVMNISGIYIVHTSAGSGVTPTQNDRVSVKYRGYYLNDLYLFDHTDSLYQEWISGMIDGLQYALKSMKTSARSEEGTYPSPGKAWIIIPSRLGWGADGKTAPPVPANTCLLYHMELYSIDNLSEEE